MTVELCDYLSLSLYYHQCSITATALTADKTGSLVEQKEKGAIVTRAHSHRLQRH